MSTKENELVDSFRAFVERADGTSRELFEMGEECERLKKKVEALEEKLAKRRRVDKVYGLLALSNEREFRCRKGNSVRVAINKKVNPDE